MKLAHFKFHNEHYCFTMFMQVGGERDDAEEWAPEVLSCEPDEIAEWLGGLSAENTGAAVIGSPDSPDFVVWFPERPPQAWLVAHEAVHGASHVLKTIGVVPLCRENEESYAYLTHWIVRKITEKIGVRV